MPVEDEYLQLALESCDGQIWWSFAGTERVDVVVGVVLTWL